MRSNNSQRTTPIKELGGGRVENGLGFILV